VSSDGLILRLQGRDAPMLLSLGRPGVLGALDIDGRPIVSPFAVEFRRLRAGAPTRPSSSDAGSELLAASLVGTTWRLNRLPGHDAPVDSPARRPTLEFSPAGLVTGSTGCNRVSGQYSSARDEISLPALVTTRMACLGGADVEGPFLAALGRVARFRLIGDWLELLDSTGALLVRFEGQPITPDPVSN
jgi:heat shock protein HslJ